MKTATSDLEEDHVHILRLIDVMEHIIQSDDPDPDHLESIVNLIRNFADGLHHAKEENILFPFLAKRGFSEKAGPVAVMLHEHAAGRNFVRIMAENIAPYRKGDREALSKIYESMTGYAVLLRAHIGKENNILFRMADKVLTAKDHEGMLSEFDSAEKTGEAKSDYIRKIGSLTAFYGI